MTTSYDEAEAAKGPRPFRPRCLKLQYRGPSRAPAVDVVDGPLDPGWGIGLDPATLEEIKRRGLQLAPGRPTASRSDAAVRADMADAPATAADETLLDHWRARRGALASRNEEDER